jgi:hypothetical protein
MPTPSSGSISVGNLETEFGAVDGRPSAIGEYTGRAGSFSGTSLGIEGVPTTGAVAFSQLRGKTAHATPAKIITDLRSSFGGNTTIAPGNTYKSYPLLCLQPTSDGNIPGSHVSPIVNFNTAWAGFDEDTRMCRNNTIIYLCTGKCKNIGQYGTGTGSGTTITPYLRIKDFKFNGLGISPQDLSVDLTWGVDHGAGNRGGSSNSFNANAKTCMAVFTTPSATPFTSCSSAQFTADGAFWNGNYGSSDSDSLHQRMILMLPNRWARVSSTLYAVGTGSMTLQPYDIAVVTTAGPGLETGYAPAKMAAAPRVSGGGATVLNPIFGSVVDWFGRSVIGVYANESNSTTTYDLSTDSYAPYVSIFRFAGDGYMTSRVV